jgi:hypothetical protein
VGCARPPISFGLWGGNGQQVDLVCVQ